MSCWQRARFWPRAALSSILALLAGCQASDGGALDAGLLPAPLMDAATAEEPVYAVHVRFEGTESGAVPPFASQPWPNLQTANEAGAPIAAPPQWPGRQRVFVDALLREVAGLPGFGLQGPVFFSLDGRIDRDSLPATAEASLASDASVFVLDIDTNSSDVFTRVPVRVRYDSAAQRIALVPASGHLFLPGRRYAAVVTTSLLDSEGRAVGPSDGFVALTQRSPMVGEDVQPAERYRAVLDVLGMMGIPSASVAGLSLFRAQAIGFADTDLMELSATAPEPNPFVARWVDAGALDQLLGEPVDGEVGLDVQGGVLHSQQRALIQLRVTVPHLLAGEPGKFGLIERDATGKWLVKRAEPITVTVMLPRSAPESGRIPLVLFAHGWGRERSDALAIADRLNARGAALVAIDAPNHGTRIPEADIKHRFVSLLAPDGFGDLEGDPVGLASAGEGGLSVHPFVYRDVLRQWALDWSAVLRIFRGPGLSTLQALGPDFEGLSFDTDQVAVVAMDMGATTAMMLATFEPAVQALALVGAGGHLQNDWLYMPAHRRLRNALLERLGVSGAPKESWPFTPEVGLHRMLLDAAEPLAWAAQLRRAPVHVLLLGSADDERVSRAGVEALARQLGMDFEPSEGTGISANPLVDPTVLRGILRFDPASHEALLVRTGQRTYDVRGQPAEPLDEPQPVDNPIDAMQDAVVEFYDEWRACLQQVSVSCVLAGPTE